MSSLNPGFFDLVSQRCPNLRRLHLSHADLTLTHLPANVEFVSVSQSVISWKCFIAPRYDEDGARVILARLREVELLNTELTEGSLAALPDSVRRLRIRDCRLPTAEESFNYTVLEPGLDNERHGRLPITDLDLSQDTEISLGTAMNFISYCPRLTVLRLNDCVFRDDFFNDDVVTALLFMIGTVCNELRFLEELEADRMLSDNDDDNVMLENFDAAMFGTNLRRLSIAGWPITDATGCDIPRKLTNLQSLNVSGCEQLTDVSFSQFANLSHTLRHLNVRSTNISNDTVDLLKLHMPECEIVQ